MTFETLVFVLPLFILLAVAAFALWSRHRTKKEMRRYTHEKSSLAKDGPGP